MQVVILAGGMGTRIRAVAAGRAKVLLPVAGKPFIEHQFDILLDNGLRDILVCVGYLGDQIEHHVGDGSRFGVRVRFAREPEGRLMGTGGALVNALPLLEHSFLLMYGDSYLPTNYQSVIRAYDACGAKCVMCVFRNEGKWDASNVRIQNGRVVSYSKSAGPGEADCIDYGLSVFRREVVEAYRGAPLPLDLARIYADLVARGELAAFVVQKRFFEIGKPDGLAELDGYLRGKCGE